MVRGIFPVNFRVTHSAIPFGHISTPSFFLEYQIFAQALSGDYPSHLFSIKGMGNQGLRRHVPSPDSDSKSSTENMKRPAL
jgi:hypothetical protein